MKKLLTIVIPCYNHGEYLEETIASIFLSTKTYIPEIIVVNDGSTDEKTIDVFRRLENLGIYILHQENLGLGAARNNGIKIAQGKYILPLDSDNNVTYHYLNTAIDILENNSAISIVYGDAQYFGGKQNLWKNKTLDKKQMLISNQIDACAVYRKMTWTKVNGYAEDMPYMGCEDWNFWLRCIDVDEQFFYLEEVCFEYRVLENSMINSVKEDFDSKVFGYNAKSLYSLYNQSMRNDYDKLETIFYGSLLRKIIKLILNHFGKYSYVKK